MRIFFKSFVIFTFFSAGVAFALPRTNTDVLKAAEKQRECQKVSKKLGQITPKGEHSGYGSTKSQGENKKVLCDKKKEQRNFLRKLFLVLATSLPPL